MRYGRKKNCVFLRRKEKNVYFCNAKEVAAPTIFLPTGAIFGQKGNKIEKPSGLGWQLYLVSK